MQGQRPEFERLDTSLDATGWQQRAIKFGNAALVCQQRANALLEREAVHARREARQSRGR